MPGDSPTLRLELTCDDELIPYCEECWEREFVALTTPDASSARRY